MDKNQRIDATCVSKSFIPSKKSPLRNASCMSSTLHMAGDVIAGVFDAKSATKRWRWRPLICGKVCFWGWIHHFEGHVLCKPHYSKILQTRVYAQHKALEENANSGGSESKVTSPRTDVGEGTSSSPTSNVPPKTATENVHRSTATATAGAATATSLKTEAAAKTESMKTTVKDEARSTATRPSTSDAKNPSVSTPTIKTNTKGTDRTETPTSSVVSPALQQASAVKSPASERVTPASKSAQSPTYAGVAAKGIAANKTERLIGSSPSSPDSKYAFVEPPTEPSIVKSNNVASPPSSPTRRRLTQSTIHLFKTKTLQVTRFMSADEAKPDSAVLERIGFDFMVDGKSGQIEVTSVAHAGHEVHAGDVLLELNGSRLTKLTRKAVLNLFRDALCAPIQDSSGATVTIQLTVSSRHDGVQQSIASVQGRYLFCETTLSRVNPDTLTVSAADNSPNAAPEEVSAISEGDKIFSLALIGDSVQDHCLRIQCLLVWNPGRVKTHGAASHRAFFRCDQGELRVGDGVWKINADAVPFDGKEAMDAAQKIFRTSHGQKVTLGIVMPNPLHPLRQSER